MGDSSLGRYSTIFLLTTFLIITGCNKNADTPVIPSSESVQLASYDDKNFNSMTADPIENMFFFKNNVTKAIYKGKFFFNDFIETDINVSVHEMSTYKNGKLYELVIDSIEGVPNERLKLGYFYVTKDRVYRIGAREDDSIKLKLGLVPDDSVVVCQDAELKDRLDVDQPGWHQSIQVKGEKREYRSYNSLVETGYYETITWEKNKGLINYRSGFGAERDSIEIQLKTF